MKRFIALAGLYFFTSISNAQTCPPANQILIEKNGKYEISLPPGWLLVSDHRPPSAHNFNFRIAAWGDHKHTNDTVRCFYEESRGSSNTIRIETQERIAESRITSHPQWDSISDLYHMCGSLANNVNECPFD